QHAQLCPHVVESTWGLRVDVARIRWTGCGRPVGGRAPQLGVTPGNIRWTTCGRLGTAWGSGVALWTPVPVVPPPSTAAVPVSNRPGLGAGTSRGAAARVRGTVDRLRV